MTVDQDRLGQLFEQVRMTEEGVAVVGRALAEVEDVTIVVTPVRWRAWDMASTFVPYLIDAGVAMDEPRRWFR